MYSRPSVRHGERSNGAGRLGRLVGNRQYISEVNDLAPRSTLKHLPPGSPRIAGGGRVVQDPAGKPSVHKYHFVQKIVVQISKSRTQSAPVQSTLNILLLPCKCNSLARIGGYTVVWPSTTSPGTPGIARLTPPAALP